LCGFDEIWHSHVKSEGEIKNKKIKHTHGIWHLDRNWTQFLDLMLNVSTEMVFDLILIGYVLKTHEIQSRAGMGFPIFGDSQRRIF
jgi:hypothetical protein